MLSPAGKIRRLAAPPIPLMWPLVRLALVGGAGLRCDGLNQEGARVTHTSKNRGFTLIEMMVAIAVLVILMAFAVPSFMAYEQRVTIRGAGDQLVNYWANARLAAVRENRNVIVSFRSSAGNMCIGATTAAAACDCLTTP